MRSALMGATLASLLSAPWLSLAAATTGPPQAPSADTAQAREILKELVETNTTHEHGSTGLAQAIARRLMASGYGPSEVQVLIPADHPTKGNVIIRLRGRSSDLKPVLFIGHLDVVEARPEDWSTDPFRLVEKDGYFYGRGTLDMKGGDAVLIETLIRLRRERYVPERDLIFAFTADEEAGGDSNGPAWLLANHREAVDAGVVLNFDGGGGTLKNGKPYVYNFDTAEKIYLTFRLQTSGPGGHGSLPGPDNPIYRLADGLGRLEAYHFPVMTTPTTRAYFAHLADTASGQEKDDLLAVSREPPDVAAAERLSHTVGFNAELRTTCVATLISGGHAENALPQRANATIQCRMMPGDDPARVEQRIVAALADPKIETALDVAPIIAPEAPLDPDVTSKLTAVVHTFWPGVPVVPEMATGFSDARRFGAAGMPTYAAGGLWLEEGENRAHGRDERISAAGFDQSVEYAFRLAKAFGGR